MGLAAQDSPRHDQAGSQAAAAAGRGRRNFGRWRQARQIRARGRWQDGGRGRGRGQARPKSRQGGRKRPLGRLRLATTPDASAQSLESFITNVTAKPLAVTTDGWAGYHGLAAKGYQHEAINLSQTWGDASLRLPAIHLVFSLAKRWLLGTHHGAVRAKHLQHYLDEFVFRFNHRKAKAISHGLARLIQHALKTPPTTYRGIVHGMAA